MSIVNGKQKRVSKKHTNVSTAAVFPILQSTASVINDKKSDNNEIHKSSNSTVFDPATSQIFRGQCIRGKPVIEHTIVSSVADFVSEVIPQGNAPNTIQSEPINWVKIQKCPCDFRGRNFTFVIIIGLARGYQIWTMLENGDCEEVVSERKGLLRVGHLLPFLYEGVDKFCSSRPLFCMVDGNPMSSEQKHCMVSFLSLKQGKIVHSIEFSQPILDIETSENCLLIILPEKLVICDHGTLTQKHCVVIPPTTDSSMLPCFSLSSNLLAFTEFHLDQQKQSCGGVMSDEEVSYSGQMMNAAKSISKTMSSIGETFVSSFTSSYHCKNGSNSNNEVADDAGIVSVINVNNPQSIDNFSMRHFIAHFVAHEDSAVGHLAFGNGGQLLLTGNQSATIFHLFILHLHPTNVKLSSVQHIYTLHRGNSTAKVINSTFSFDNRWLSIATNHGTTHIFAITPYGGPVTARTHCSKFVNKESRFQRSAGITSVKQVIAAKNINSTSSKVINRFSYREHPAIIALPVISKSVNNPRLTFYQTPIQLYSLAKIKQRAFSAESLSAWASDNAPTLLGGGNTLGSGRSNTINFHNFNCNSTMNSYGPGINDAFASNKRIALKFDSSFGAIISSDEYNLSLTSKSFQKPILCLYILNSEGLLTEHKLYARREGHPSGSSLTSISSLTTNNITDQSLLSSSPTSVSNVVLSTSNHQRSGEQDATICIKMTAVVQWILRRNHGVSNVEVIKPPLSESNPLIKLSSKILAKNNLLYDNERTKHTQNCKKTPIHTNNSWLQQVEIVTYSGPHRRLWMGPQFSFSIYSNTGHYSAQLFNPKNSAETFPSMQKCCPVLIEKNAFRTINSLDNSTSRIVCGSWSSDIGDLHNAYGTTTYSSVKEKIEDAMRDVSEPFENKKSQKKIKKRSKNSNQNFFDNSIELLQFSGMEL